MDLPRPENHLALLVSNHAIMAQEKALPSPCRNRMRLTDETLKRAQFVERMHVTHLFYAMVRMDMVRL